MNGELHPSEPSDYAIYALGRMSAQNERALGDFGKALQHRFQAVAPAINVDALIAENELLRRQLAATQADLNELEGIYSRLKAWGTQVSQVLREHGLIKT